MSGYKQGDFIARNKVLGKEARYYDALTETEQARIDAILDMDDLFDDEIISEVSPLSILML